MGDELLVSNEVHAVRIKHGSEHAKGFRRNHGRKHARDWTRNRNGTRKGELKVICKGVEGSWNNGSDTTQISIAFGNS